MGMPGIIILIKIDISCLFVYIYCEAKNVAATLKALHSMKFLSLYMALFISSTFVYSQKTIDATADSVFTLCYQSVGLGSNKYRMRPVFKVIGTRFIYTSEQLWQFNNVNKAKPDTLQMGDVSISSIDSILTIAKEIKGDSVYGLNPWILSGAIVYLNITSPLLKLKFKLDNSFDETAKKIVDILNTYITNKYRKLVLSTNQPTIKKIM
jgi:hypothetical protein